MFDQCRFLSRLTRSRSEGRAARKNAGRRGKPRVNRKLQFDLLEDRLAPAVYTVTTLGDDPGTVTDTSGGAGTSFNATTLRAAINHSNGNDALDTINFAGVLAGGTIVLNSELPTITEGVTIDGSAGSQTGERITITGDRGTPATKADDVRIISINQVRVETQGGNAVKQDVILRNFNFLSGNSAGGAADTSNGGAIRVLGDGDVFLENMLIRDSVATDHGGAIYKFNANNLGELWITNLRIRDNRADFDNNGTGNGGAVYLDGGYMRVREQSGDTLIDGNIGVIGGAIFQNNSIGGTIEILEGVAIDGNGSVTVTQFGGGIASLGGPRYDPPGNPGDPANNPHISPTGRRLPFTENLLITGANNNEVTFNGNTADSGGAIYISSAIANLSEVTFVNNFADGALATQGGGAMFIEGSPSVSVGNADFTNNQAIGALGRGGAVFTRLTSGSASFLTGSMRNNSAHSGGALHHGGTGGNTSITGFIVESNSATLDGGGLHASGAGTLGVTNSTIRQNTAGNPLVNDDGSGGGIYVSGNVNLNITSTTTSTIIELNAARGTGVDQGGGGIYVQGPATASISSGFSTTSIRNNTANQGQASGGGVHIAGGTVTASNLQVHGNQAAQDGGGFHNFGGTLTISGGDVYANTAARHGGGVNNTGTLTINSNANIGSANQATRGGGVYNATGATGTLTGGSDIFSNIALESGGGWYNDAGATANLIGNSTITNNVANGSVAGQGGGGVYNAGVLFAQNMTISSNRADGGVTGGGGGLLNAQGGAATVLNSTMNSNVAEFGGAFRNIDTPSLITIADVNFNTNTANQRGGVGDMTGGVVSVNGGQMQDNVANLSGGGFATVDATLILKNSIIARNTAQNDQGGAFYNDQGFVQISNATMTLNRTNGTNGGDGGGAIFNNGTMFVTDSTVHSNFALGANADGGGVLNTSSGNLTFIRGTVSGNMAGRHGGGISNANGAFTIQSTEVISNRADADNNGTGNGGGMHLVGTNSTLNLTGGAFRDNIAGQDGGGIWTEGTLTLTNVIMLRNTASGAGATNGGGAIYNNGGTITSTGGTFNNNKATGAAGKGGAIYNNGGTVSLTGGTVNSNQASGSGSSGGGIFNASGTLQLTNVTVNANTAAGNAGTMGGGAVFSGGGTVTINGGALTNNTVTGHFGSGGAVFASGGTLNVNGTTISGNRANLAGGGIQVTGATTANLTDAILENNTVTPDALAPGDIIIVGYRGEDLDGTPNNGNDQAIAWVPLVNLVPGQVIYFTDSGWRANNTFRGQEGAIKYTAPAEGLDAGTVMHVQFSGGAGTPGAYTFIENDPGTYAGANDANVGTNGLNISSAGDNLFIFSGSTAAPSFVFGLKNEDTTFDADSTADDETALPAALTVGTSAVALGADPNLNFDNGRYIGANVGTRALLLGAVTNVANWQRVEDLPFVGPNDNDITNGRTIYDVTDLLPEGGGGLHAGDLSIVSILRGRVNSNTSAREGGGLWNHGGGQMTLTDVTVSGNSAGVFGGGIYQDNESVTVNSKLVVNTSTIDTNTALHGAGLYVLGSTATVNTSTISGNSATQNGGGVAAAGGTVNLRSATIASNTAGGAGGGVHISGATVNATSTLIGDNTAAASPDVLGTINGSFNLVENTTGAVINGSSNILNRDPRLDILTNNGGATRTHALKRGSPALDQGVDAPAFGFDQQHLTRPFNSGGFPPPGGDLSDIGAFESQIPPLQLIGLQGGNTLVRFNDLSPQVTTTQPIIGLQAGEQIIAIDSRVADHQLYGVSNQNKIYRINPNTGQVTLVSSLTTGLTDGVVTSLDQNRHFFISNLGLFEGAFGLGEKWLKGVDVENTGNPWYVLLPTGDLYKWQGTSSLGILIATLGSNVHDNLKLLTDAFDGFGSLPAAEQTALRNFDQTNRLYRASSGDFFVNFLGQNEKWVRGKLNQFNNPWYIIASNGDVRAWDNVSFSSSPVLGSFNPIIHADPSILYTAFDRSAALPGPQQPIAQALDQSLDFFYYPKTNLWENFLGLNEKWFLGDAASGNGFSGYYVLPDGRVFRGDGTQVGTFDQALWDNLDLLVKADDPFASLPAADQNTLRTTDFLRGLYASSNDNPYFFDMFGANEKWIRGDTNVHGNPWYLILPTGELRAWNGGGGASGTSLGMMGTEAYQNPEVLFAAYDRSATLNNFVLDANDEAGADFDPTAGQVGLLQVNDSLRLVIDDNVNQTSHNFQIDVATGMTERDSGLPANRFVPDIAYSENKPSAVNPLLYTIDFVSDSLFRMDPNSGALTLVGALNAGVDFLDGGLEIATINNQNTALAVLKVDVGGGQLESRLYNIDLVTGQAEPIGAGNGKIGSGFDDIHGVALSPSALDQLFGAP